ncbi:non-specific serine/threonine protein kinase OS=Streptomyces fumanus OX=67302 GN=GCM10018772_00760 PE=3 SV=1 [Streptomyces fumanus]
MNATTTEVRTLHVSRLHLVAVPSAVSVSREFVRRTLKHWRSDDHAPDASLVMSQLVSNAVKAMGFTEQPPHLWEITSQHVVAVQLRAIGGVLFIEVWDDSPDEPVKHNVTADIEGGRGLHLVEALSEQWGIYRPPAGGKIVWARNVLPMSPSPALDGSTLRPRVPEDLEAPPGRTRDQATIALMQRVLDGLRNVP